MFGFEAAGAAALVHNRVFENPETIATAIQIGNPASWNLAVSAVQESDGQFDEVSDEEIVAAYKKLASSEGVFAEPASCASIAGVYKNIKNGKINKGTKIVAVLTGNGLKDPDTAIAISLVKPIQLPNDEKAVTEHIRGVVHG
jgi:threonine synthase